MTSKRKRKYSQDFSGGSLTDRSFTAEADINNIVATYDANDPYYVSRQNSARYGDAIQPSFETRMVANAELNSAFASQPASVRAQHANDPHAWLDYLASDHAPQELHDSLATPPDEPSLEDSTGGEDA